MNKTTTTIHTEDKEPITSKVDISKYSLYNLCRWSALEEAVNIIGDKCEERNIDFEKIKLDPLEILEYVDKVTDTIYNKVSTT
jgi:hypothetical protein